MRALKQNNHLYDVYYDEFDFNKDWWYDNENMIPKNFDIEVKCMRQNGIGACIPCGCFRLPCDEGTLFYKATKEYKKEFNENFMEFLLS